MGHTYKQNLPTCKYSLFKGCGLFHDLGEACDTRTILEYMDQRAPPRPPRADFSPVGQRHRSQDDRARGQVRVRDQVGQGLCPPLLQAGICQLRPDIPDIFALKQDSWILRHCSDVSTVLSVRSVGMASSHVQRSNTSLEIINRKCEVLMHPTNVLESY